MQNKLPGINLCPVKLCRKDLITMIRFVRIMHNLSQLPSYQQIIDLPKVAQFAPKNFGVMMGYDFHITEQGPKLIEINTNAGGGSLAFQAACLTDIPTFKLKKKLIQMFAQEISLYGSYPSRIAIVDDEPEKQFFFPEMQEFAKMLTEDLGIPTDIVAPCELENENDKLFFNGNQIDMIYNRHCDFYLETLPHIKYAYLANNICLTPNPRIYGLLADKKRMIIWSNLKDLLELGLDATTAKFITSIVPESCLLAGQNIEQIWNDRKQWVFKPINKFGSRGVIIGSSLRKKRFNDLPAQETLVQRLVKPSLTDCEEFDKPMKTDIRVFAYRDKILGIGARLYQGQVTNFQEQGSGYAPVCLNGIPLARNTN
ncbi:hypothetical protein QUF74_07455 [Candidatus Halobeggiatoa sp. HSG11]|nr:hypothetical protein [Candidatus Halobeggiatoa sp. HSG11]